MNSQPPYARNARAENGSSAPLGSSSLGAARVSTIGIFVVLLLAALHFAQPVVMPVFIALVFGIVLTPVSAWAARHRIPHWLSAMLLVIALIAALSMAIVQLAEPVRDWIEKAPEFGAILREKLRFLDRPIAAMNTLRTSLAGPADPGEGGIKFDVYSTLVQPALAAFTPALGQLIVFFATLFFFLAGREKLRRQFLTYWGNRKTRLDAMHFLNDTEKSLAGYVGVVTAINLALGLVLGVFAYLIGLPNPLVWGILAFALNYVPYLGAAVVVLILLGVSLMSFDSIAYALVAPAFYVAVSTLEGQFITPSIVGYRLALSPLLVFLVVAFWTWFWGPFGGLLAVPLLIIGMVALNHVFPKDEAKIPD